MGSTRLSEEREKCRFHQERATWLTRRWCKDLRRWSAAQYDSTLFCKEEKKNLYHWLTTANELNFYACQLHHPRHWLHGHFFMPFSSTHWFSWGKVSLGRVEGSWKPATEAYTSQIFNHLNYSWVKNSSTSSQEILTREIELHGMALSI